MPTGPLREPVKKRCFKNRASAEKLCILTVNAAAASAQALAALLLLCDGILASNLPSDRAPRNENIACSVIWHSAAKAQVLRLGQTKDKKVRFGRAFDCLQAVVGVCR